MNRPTGARSPRAGIAGLLGALLALSAAADDPGGRQLRIESDPPGAEVLLIGGSAGRTPLSVGERAIYPNDYSDEQAPLYGLVTLRRAGCATHVQRVTLDDIEHGMRVRLRQLQVLQELLDEGLMSAAEEQRIRRALLRSP